MRRSALAVSLLLVVTSLVTVAAASPVPKPVCGPCGGGLTAATHGDSVLENLVVERSTATVRVHDDGSATWRVENRLANESLVEYLADRPERVDALVAEALELGAVEGPFRNVSATMDGSTLRVRYEDPDAVRRVAGGVRVVEYFHSRGHDAWWTLTADRLTVVTPPGTTVTNDPPGATVDGRNATWHGEADVPQYDAPIVERDAYVAFGDGPALGPRTALGVAAATAPIVVDVLLAQFLPPLVVLAAGLGTLSLGTHVVVGRRDALSHRAGATAVAGLGGLCLCLGVSATVLPGFTAPRWLVELGAVYLSMGGVARLRGPDAPGWAVPAAGALVVAGIGVAFAATAHGEFLAALSPSGAATRRALRYSPLVAMTVAGATLASDGPVPSAVGGLTVLAAFVASLLSTLWPTQRPAGPALLIFLGAALAFVVLGAPLFLLGALHAGTSEADDAGD